MIVIEQIWTGNRARNFNYLLGCAETGEALAIDPLDHRKVLAASAKRGWSIKQILNTHDHHDHTGGNLAVKDAIPDVKILAHGDAVVPGKNHDLQDGDRIAIGKSGSLLCLDTPGHTMSHICALLDGEKPALFSGDTLFNAGVGNCHNGGHPVALYQTFSTMFERISEATLIYPGHDYLENNLQFTLDREPNNQMAQKLLLQVKQQAQPGATVTTLGQEKEINVFLRLDQPEVIAGLRQKKPDLPQTPSAKEVFVGLRELRNDW